MNPSAPITQPLQPWTLCYLFIDPHFIFLGRPGVLKSNSQTSCHITRKYLVGISDKDLKKPKVI